MPEGRLKEMVPFIALFIVFTLLPVGGRIATGADQVTLAVYNPTGSVEVTQLFAPRLADLDGKTVCELHNDNWESKRTFPAIRQALKDRYPTVKIIEYTKMPYFSERSTPQDYVKMVAAVKAAGCQAAILGNAG
jgi:hypothetical protein